MQMSRGCYWMTAHTSTDWSAITARLCKRHRITGAHSSFRSHFKKNTYQLFMFYFWNALLCKSCCITFEDMMWQFNLQPEIQYNYDWNGIRFMQLYNCFSKLFFKIIFYLILLLKNSHHLRLAAELWCCVFTSCRSAPSREKNDFLKKRFLICWAVVVRHCDFRAMRPVTGSESIF